MVKLRLNLNVNGRKLEFFKKEAVEEELELLEKQL